MPYRWVRRPGADQAEQVLNQGLAGNRVVNAAKRAGRDVRKIDQGRAEELGWLQSPDLASELQGIQQQYADDAFANDPSQSREAMFQRMRDARQNAGLRNINAVSQARMGLLGMQMQGQTNKQANDLAYRLALARTAMDADQREQYTSGWNMFGGLLAGGLKGFGQVLAGA